MRLTKRFLQCTQWGLLFITIAGTAVSASGAQPPQTFTSAPATTQTSRPAQTETPPDVAEYKRLQLKDLMDIQVSTISRIDEKIDEAPGAVYVYPRQVIQERGYRSLGELLQVVPGFCVFHRDLQFVAPVRGLVANDNEKISLLVNGQNVNGVNEPGFLNGPINLDNVERVEVVVGPSSLFQQGDTLAATVNVITRDVDGVEVHAAAGNNLRYSGTLMAGHHWAPDQYLGFSLTTENKRGFDAWHAAFRPNLAGRNLTGTLDEPNFFSVVKGQYGDLSGQIVLYRTASPELLIDNGNLKNHGNYTDDFYSIYLKSEPVFSPTLTGIFRFQAGYKEQTRESNATPFPPSSPQGLALDAEQESVKQAFARAELGVRYTGFTHHVIQGGFQLTYENNFDSWFTYQQDAAVAPPYLRVYNKTTLVNDDSWAAGFYVDDEYQATDRLKLVGGIRLDRNARLPADRWYPGGRAAVIYRMTDDWVTKLIYNRAVRMPSALAAMNEAWGKEHSPTLSPAWASFAENASQPEILSTFEWQNVFYLGSARLGVGVYHQELEEFITWNGPHTNVGNFRGNGVELSLQAPLSDTLTFWANAAYNNSKLYASNEALTGTAEQHHINVNPDHYIVGAPQFTANMGLDWRITRHITLSPTIRYFTEQAAYDFQRGAGRGSTFFNDGFITIRNPAYLDATLSWTDLFGKDTDLRISGYNLLNDRSVVGSPWLGDTYHPQGATFVISVCWRF